MVGMFNDRRPITSISKDYYLTSVGIGNVVKIEPYFEGDGQLWFAIYNTAGTLVERVDSRGMSVRYEGLPIALYGTVEASANEDRKVV